MLFDLLFLHPYKAGNETSVGIYYTLEFSLDYGPVVYGRYGCHDHGFSLNLGYRGYLG